VRDLVVFRGRRCQSRGVLLTAFVQRIRWLDSAVVNPEVASGGSQQAV
jgi:hypothetical protein